MNVLLLYPDRRFQPEGAFPPQTEDLVADLGLDVLFEAMSQGDEFIHDVVKEVLLSGETDVRTIRYRQAVLQDCLAHPDVVRRMYDVPLQALKRKREQWLGIFGSYYPSSILSSGRHMLEAYFELLRELRQIADRYGTSFRSPGFRRFFAMLQQELDDAYLATVSRHLKMLRFRRGVWVSARLGRGNEGTGYVLRRPDASNGGWMHRILGKGSPIYTYTLPSRDDQGVRTLAQLRDRGLNRAANAVAQAAEHVESFLMALRAELAFYIGALNLAEMLDRLGMPVTFPVPAPLEEERWQARGLYNIVLALNGPSKVVPNDVSADGKRLVIITGANQGGKSTFLRSVGLAQLMMQSGMFVPAVEFSASVSRHVFTHFKREEDSTMKSGKLDEELARMSRIVDRLRPGAMVLFNESFAATNEHEGSEIARHIVSALVARGIRVFFVTHLYEFARGLWEEGREDTLFLRAERRPDGRRTFRIIPGAPLPTGFGPDLYREIFASSSS